MKWIPVTERYPLMNEDIGTDVVACKQVKIVFTYKGTAYLGIGMFTRWKDGTLEWSELSEDKNCFTEMAHGMPTHYIILPDIP